jgi:hypothetical protein
MKIFVAEMTESGFDQFIKPAAPLLACVIRRVFSPLIPQGFDDLFRFRVK